jgi:hypothetical protein
MLLSVVSMHCSDEDPPGAATEVSVDTGLPQTLKLSELDDDDAKAACEALNQGALQVISDRELVRSQCASYAINETSELNSAKTEASVDVAMCNKLADSCMADPERYSVAAESGRGENDCSKAVASRAVQGCQATVAEYEACLSKVIGQTKQALAIVTCGNGKSLIESDGAATKLEPLRFAECKLFLDKCPDVRITATVDN